MFGLEGHAMDLPSITETNRIHLVLFGMQDKAVGPHLAAIHRILISAVKSAAPYTPRVGFASLHLSSILSDAPQAPSPA
jgi:hypothetical protein